MNYKCMTSFRTGRPMLAVGAIAGALASALAAAPAQAQSARELAAMRQQIEALQELVRSQAEALEAQSRRLNELEQQAEAQRAEPPVTRRSGVASGRSETRLQVYGQVNRGVLYGNNGDDSQAFFVDNSASSSRFGLLAEAAVEGVTLGSRLEFDAVSNPSSGGVSGDAFGPDDGSFNFRERHIDVFVSHPSYGRLSLGQGSNAGDGAQEVDLGGTSVGGGYSDIAALGGSLRFDKERGGSVVRVRNAFSNFDPGRDDRIRYDTPTFAGFTASGSVNTDGQSELALRWGGAFDNGLRAALGAHVQWPSDFDHQVGASGSLLWNGVSATVAGAVRETKSGDDRDPWNVYGKLGYDFSAFRIGGTSVAADVFYGEDIAAKGDESTSLGLFAVQRIDPAATDLYLGYRFYGLSAADVNFSDVHAVLTGARIRF